MSQRIGEFDFAVAPGAALNVAAVLAWDQPGLLARQPGAFAQEALVDTLIASLSHDADDKHIQATVNGWTAVYPFDHYEAEGTTVRK